jgi:hypothetical protein
VKIRFNAPPEHTFQAGRIRMCGGETRTVTKAEAEALIRNKTPRIEIVQEPAK